MRYDSGVEADADVALRRHVVTQAAQAGGRLTMEAMRAYGHRLVITDAHFGARPSHAVWQGKPACMDGPATVDGVKYPGLAQLTGYGTVQGLHGANCKHSLNPYYPGITELPDRSFAAEREHFGMGPDEYYEATQRQRAMERAIRATKRQIAAMEQAGAGLDSPAYVQKRLVLGNQQKRLREWCSSHNLQRMPEREKAYGVAKQPRALTGAKWRNGKTQHAKERQAERNITDAQIEDARRNPLYSYPVEVDKDRRRAQKLIGAEATIVINPDTGFIITVYRTKSRLKRKYERMAKEQEDEK